MTSWLLDVPAQDAYRDGTLISPTKRQWDFIGFDISYNSVTQRIEVRGGGSSVDWKESVRAATTAALPANTRVANVLTADANGALAAQDGVTLAVGDRFLVKNEALSENNGPYTIAALGQAAVSPWSMTRAVLSDESSEVTPGLTCYVEEGTTLVRRVFRMTTPAPITLNTTGLLFEDAGSTILVTAAAEGTVNVLGAANTILTTDGVTPGGAWAKIVDANVDAAAAIACTKLDGAFAGVSVSTNGSVAAGTFVSAGSYMAATTYITAGSYVAIGSSPAAGGSVRLANLGSVAANNFLGTADIELISLDAANAMHIGDGAVSPAGIIYDSTTTHLFRVGGSFIYQITSTELDLVLPLVSFRDTLTSPIIRQDNGSGVGTGQTLLVKAQTLTGAGSTGGNLNLSAGDGVSKSGTIDLIQGVLRQQHGGTNGVNIETLAADKTMTLDDPQVHFINCNGAGRNCDLPPEADIAGAMYVIHNETGGAFSLTVRDDAGGGAYSQAVADTETLFVFCDGTTIKGILL